MLEAYGELATPEAIEREADKAIHNEARARIQEAVAEGSRIAGEVKDQAREESRRILARSREELARDVAKARVQLRDDVVGMAIKAAEKIITTRLNEAEQRRLLDDFLKEIDKV